MRKWDEDVDPADRQTGKVRTIYNLQPIYSYLSSIFSNQKVDTIDLCEHQKTTVFALYTNTALPNTWAIVRPPTPQGIDLP